MLPKEELEALLSGRHRHPHRVLGMHATGPRKGKQVSVRALLWNAVRCEVVDLDGDNTRRYPLRKRSDDGFYEGLLEGRSHKFPYRLRVEQENGEIRQFFDPYSFPPSLSDEELDLLSKGKHSKTYEILGAQFCLRAGVRGVSFAVWAPRAEGVSIVGDFNNWDGRYHPMCDRGSSGFWELFIPGLGNGMLYKFEIRTRGEGRFLKSDPFATFYQSPPHSAAILCDLSGFKWNDQAWMERRCSMNWGEVPISVYEVHAGSWRRDREDGNRSLSYRELAVELAAYVKRMNFTHVEFLPLAEYPFDGSWGYQVTGYFAPTHRFGEPHDFMFLVDHLHGEGIGVILDWVPGHFPDDSFALARFDGEPLYEYADPRQGVHQDWGTLIFDYGNSLVRAFLMSSALAWADRYHVDGLRVDAVASMIYLDYSREKGEWIPNKYGGRENLEALDFLREANDVLHRRYPGFLMIAEESSAWPKVTGPTKEGGLGFDFKWNMGWMNDVLGYFSRETGERKRNHKDLTFGAVYQFSEHFVQVFSHDEVVHGKASMMWKMPAHSMTEKAQMLRSLYTLMWAWPGKKTLFMGGEFGQSSEWKYDAALDWDLLQYMDHQGMQLLVADLNELYRRSPSLFKTDGNAAGFQWISGNDAENSVICFLRRIPDDQDVLLVVGHYADGDLSNYRLGVPREGFWREEINSNAGTYGGSGTSNRGGLTSGPLPCDGQPHSLALTLPPHTTIVFRLDGAHTE